MEKRAVMSVIVLVVAGTATAVPNPAAWYCVELGYDYQVRQVVEGNSYGVCVFSDGSECNAWEYFRKCYEGQSSADCDWPCQELPCREAGEPVYLSECCGGLKEIRPANIFDANCNEVPMVGWLPICSDCGNGICESWESRCNCPEDCGEPRIIHVDADAAGANDGSSWADAYNCLQDALADANFGAKPAEIRVAQGVYKPDQGAGQTPGDREATFQLFNGVALAGGYAGFGEPDPHAQDVGLFETVLSGDLNGDDEVDPNAERRDNSCHIVTGSHADASAVIDGFTITAGTWLPHGCSDDSEGGAGMYIECGSPTVCNCLFSENRGFRAAGGLLNRKGGNPTVFGCTFVGNIGGIENSESNPVLANCIFTGNRSFCVHNHDGSCPIITNCTFENNYGDVICNEGGSSPPISACKFKNNYDCGIYAWGCNSTITDCTFEGNGRDGSSSGIFCSRSSLTLVDCVFKGNADSGIEGSGNLTLFGCSFVGNSGITGAGIDLFGRGHTTLYHCTFEANTTKARGGAIMAVIDHLSLYDCTFSGNSAASSGGGVVVSETLTATGCTFRGNSAHYGHGGGVCSYGYTVLSNCTFAGNKGEGSAIFQSGYGPACRAKMRHCIVWDGEDAIFTSPAEEQVVTVSYSDVQGGWSGEGNIDVDPCFAEPGYWDPNGTPEDSNDDFWVDGDYHLKSQAGRYDPGSDNWVTDDVTSPCIDAGDAMSPVGNELFPNGGVINMGAYGGTEEASKSYFGGPVCETIVAGDTNGDCKVDFADFAIVALHWLARGQDFVNSPPTVVITEPLDGTHVYYPDPVIMRVDASDTDGSVIKVTFEMEHRTNGITSSGRIDSDGTDGWQCEWVWWESAKVIPTANWTIVAQATDDDGAVGVSQEVTVTLHKPE